MLSSDNQKTCIQCNSTLTQNAKFCSECGTAIAEPPPIVESKEGTEPDSAEEILKLDNGGATNVDEDWNEKNKSEQVAEIEGIVQAKVAEELGKTEIAQPRAKKSPVLVIVIVAICASLLGYWYAQKDDSASDEAAVKVGNSSAEITSFNLSRFEWKAVLDEIKQKKQSMFNGSGYSRNFSDEDNRIVGFQYNLQALNPKMDWYVGKKLAQSREPLDINSKYSEYLDAVFFEKRFGVLTQEGWGQFMKSLLSELHVETPSENLIGSDGILLAREIFMAMINDDYIVREMIITQLTYGSSGIYGDLQKKGIPTILDSWLSQNNDVSLFEEWKRRDFSWFNEPQSQTKGTPTPVKLTKQEYLDRGRSYQNKWENQKAIEEFNKAIRIDPNFSDAYIYRGESYYYLGLVKEDLSLYEKAIDDLNNAIRIDPNLRRKIAYHHRGKAYHELGQYERAIEDFNEFIRINPNEAMGYNGRGHSYLELGQKLKADADFKRRCELNSIWCY